MIDIDRKEVEFQCPNCTFYNKIRIRQARLRDVVICRGCKGNIQLDDEMNEVKKARRSITHALNELKKQIADINLEIGL